MTDNFTDQHGISGEASRNNIEVNWIKVFWEKDKDSVYRKKETYDKNIKWIKTLAVQIAKIFLLFLRVSFPDRAVLQLTSWMFYQCIILFYVFLTEVGLGLLTAKIHPYVDDTVTLIVASSSTRLWSFYRFFVHRMLCFFIGLSWY